MSPYKIILKIFYHLTWIPVFLISLVTLSHAGLPENPAPDQSEGSPAAAVSREEFPAREVSVEAVKPYYHDREEGWFWYVESKPPKKKEKQKSKATPQPERIEPKDFKTGWPDFKNPDELHAYEKQLLDNAVMDPTPEKVEQYLYFQKYIMSKSRLFTDVARQVIWSTPELDQEAVHPRAPYARTVSNQLNQEETRRKMREIGRIGGIFFFFSSTCPYCHLEAPILKRFEEYYGIQVVAVSLDGGGLPEYPHPVIDQGAGAALEIQSTPTLFFGKPPGDLRRISNGFVTFNELQERIINVTEGDLK